MFYYVQIDSNSKITSMVKSTTKLDSNNLVEVTQEVDIHNKEGKEFYYDWKNKLIYSSINIEVLKAQKWDMIKELQEIKISSGFEYKGIIYDSDEKARAAILNTRMSNIDVTWTTSNNNFTFFTAEEFNNFHSSLIKWINSIHTEVQKIRILLNESTSAEEINTIDIQKIL